MAEKAFYRVRTGFAVVLHAVATGVEGVFKRVEAEAGAILHLTPEEAADHALKIEPATDDQVAEAGHAVNTPEGIAAAAAADALAAV